ncbi:MAG TPA: PilW family protein [Casimicrobiaceae bacterium]|jgi:type IV pilus assembly protein PilW|nr:PilW family protein [Casimicrobiaceae bacterium]
MMTERSSARSHRKQSGFGLIEIMVGVVIGLIAVLVIYQVYAVAEGFKRNTTAAGEAQQNGLFSAFVLGMEIGNGGAGMAAAAQDLASCPDPGGAMPQRFAQSFRPIPVLITDGGASATSDSFVVNYSMATTLANSALFTGIAAPGATFPVQSPGGFHVDDLVVGISAPTAPGSPCASSRVTAVTVPDANGIVTITQTPLFPAGGIDFFGSSVLLNMGPCNRAQKIQYSVNNGVLYSTPLIDTGAANCGELANPLIGNPLASNILVMKVEYGIDSDLDPKRLLDTWVQASAAGWDPATLLPAPITTINQIKAVRIGIIVQSDQFDKNLAGFTGGDYVNGDYNWVLFDCADANKANCPGRLTGSVPATVSPAGNWRFRKYETVIPLRNEIWNRT